MRPSAAIFLFTAAVIFALPPRPGTAESRDEVQSRLKAAEEAATKERANEKEARMKEAELLEELEGLRRELVKRARAVQETERLLSEAESKLSALHEEEKAQAATLERRQSQLAAMTSAAIRLSQTPPEAALMLPGDFQRTLAASRVLASLMESIRRESEEIIREIQALKDIEAKVARGRERAEAERRRLIEERKSLDSRLAERTPLVAALVREQEESRRKAAALGREAKDLRELLSSLTEAERAREAARRAEEAKAAAQAREEKKSAPPPRPKAADTQGVRMRAFASARGALKAPVQGKVKRRFGDALSRNETSKGVLIAAGKNARVVAPYDGEVVFTGPFLNYGRMVILRHRDDYHTLLAGFSRIDVGTGEFLLEGEPIGAMGDTSTEAELYVELREKNQPVDPAAWVPAFRR